MWPWIYLPKKNPKIDFLKMRIVQRHEWLLGDLADGLDSQEAIAKAKVTDHRTM